jgi:hypothetical protein
MTAGARKLLAFRQQRSAPVFSFRLKLIFFGSCGLQPAVIHIPRNFKSSKTKNAGQNSAFNPPTTMPKRSGAVVT